MKQEKMDSLKKALWKGNQGVFAIAFVTYLVASAINLYLSYILQVVTDIAAGVSKERSLGQVALQVLLVAIGMGIVMIIGAKTQNLFYARAMRQYRDAIFRKLSKKGIGAFRKENTSLYVSGMTNDAAVIEDSYLTGIFTMGQQIFLFAGALILMLYYSPLLTLIAIGFSLLPVIASICTGKKLVGLEKEVSDRNQSFLAQISEILMGFSVVKSFKAEERIAKIVGESNENLESSKRKRNVNKDITSSIGSFAGASTQIGVFLVGAWMCLKGRGITPGMLFVFTNLLNFIIGPIAQLPGVLAKRKAALSLMEKMEKALMEERETENLVEDCTLERSVQIDHLTYSYDGKKKVLDDLSFKFDQGKSYAIVGASGCGKSTLLQLLLAGMSGYEGSICYDGTNLRRIKPESLYDTVSTIQQNVFVFNASIRDNVTMFKEFAKEEVDRVIDMAGLRELIREKGEDYLCGENGSGLSGGEKQRISIARALLHNAKLLLVDEATAALDAETSSRVIKAILELKDVTRIVVTHDLDAGLLQKYDSILTLKNGKIIEDGSFDVLMKNKGYFYSLYTVAQ